MRRNLLFLSGLLGLTLATLWPVEHLGFNGYDDYDYVCQNPFVNSGLNFKNIIRAFTAAWAGNWHPLTWLSHMLDCQLFGLNPKEEHLVNLGWHIVDTLLLFGLLQQMTGARWRSFLVAALFGVHPLHVQSVAWISERKDVLSGFFALLTLTAYTHYSRRKTGANYALVLFLFALGLMAKPMLVTLPLVMLLLDYWPLGRVAAESPNTPAAQASRAKWRRWIAPWLPLVAEKIPLMLLCLASCILTMWAQRAGGAIVPAQDMAWQEHCLQPLASYSLYLGKLFWPAELAIFYPYTRLAAKDLIWLVALPILLSALCLWQRRRRPHLLVGWLWFVIMLIPVIGFVRVGMQSIADRYTYLPSIGIFIAVAWAMAEIAAISKPWRAGMACSGFMMLLACGADTRYQLGFWRDDISLFKHVEAVTTKHNFLGCFFLGNAYRNLNDLENAASNYTRALEMAPGFIPARAKLGYVLLLQEKYPAAEAEFRTILRQEPENIYAHTSLGLALSGQQRDTDARLEYQAALQLKPDDASLKEYLSTTTRRLSVEQDLTDLFSQLKTNDTPQIHCQIAVDQNFLGHYQSAVEQYQITLAIAPDSLEGLNNLAWLLATCSDAGVRDGKRAVELAQHACQLTGEKKTVVLGTLAAAYAEAGRFDEAIATAQKACASATAKGETELLAVNQKLLAQYQQHQPYHEAAEKLVPGAP